MLTRFHKILGAVLAAQIVLAVIVHLRGDDRAIAHEQPMFAGFDAAKVTRAQIINDSKTLDLVKKGAAWVVASGFDYPAVASKVDDALAPLAKVTAGAPIATQKTRHKQLNVDDHEFGSKVTLTADGKDITLFIGSAVGRRTAVRRAGEDTVYAVSGLTQGMFSGHMSRWVESKYVTIERDQIASIKIERPAKTIELTKQTGTPDGEATWAAIIDGAPLSIAAGERVSTLAIDGVVNNLTSLSVQDPGDPKRDASKATATISITLGGKDGAPAPGPIVIDIVDDAGKAWVHQRGLESAIILDAGQLDAVLSLTPEKLVEKVPATPPPAPAGAPSNLPPGVTPEMIQEALRKQGMQDMSPE